MPLLKDSLNEFILTHLPRISENMEWHLSAIQEYYVEAYRHPMLHVSIDDRVQNPEMTQFQLAFIAVPDYKREVRVPESQTTDALLIATNRRKPRRTLFNHR